MARETSMSLLKHDARIHNNELNAAIGLLALAKGAKTNAAHVGPSSIGEPQYHFEATQEEDEDDEDKSLSEYADEIFENMRSSEKRMKPDPDYMSSYIDWSKRSMLIEWLVQVHERFDFSPQTLFLCVNYLDRFLSVKMIDEERLQLVGATALFLAAKFEGDCLSLRDIVTLGKEAYSKKDVLQVERDFLRELDCAMNWPGPMSFLNRVSKVDSYDVEICTLAKYFLETTIVDELFVAYVPSFLAAGAYCLALLTLTEGGWVRCSTLCG
ncbi:hypothetical protein DPSP01_014658 [Paraphaeosphaeria sporulosa]